MNTQTAIVVGIDAAGTSYAVARYAAEEARQRDLPLTLVHAFSPAWIDLPLTAEQLADPLPRTKAHQVLTAVAGRIGLEYPDVPVTAEFVDGHPAAILVDRSPRAALLVVGHRGSGGFGGLLAGSVALHTAAHAHCPVVVVRGTPAGPDAPVVVGVDGSPTAALAVRFAADVASRRKAPLLAVAIGPRHAEHAERTRAVAARQALTAMIADDLVDTPEVTVDVDIRYDHSPAAGLIRAADGAALVVVASRGLGGLRGLLLGSVGRALIAHAPCPVAIVHAAEQPAHDSGGDNDEGTTR